MARVLMEFDEMIGQTNVVRWFKSCLQRDKLPQVIMLSGPAGIGKTSIAKLAACECSCITKPSLLENTKDVVIKQKSSTDSVRVYNMSNLKSQDAVAEVKADLQVGLSSTGRKVIIMDEAHGMSQEAQDSLLTTFEALPLNVWVIICTTNISNFQESFLSRVLLRRLTNLSIADMRLLLKRHIADKGLKFEISESLAITLITNYSGREPRKALNLIESFEDNASVTVDELDTFFNVYEGKQLVQLIRYMYNGELLQGLDFINEFEIGTTFNATLLDLLRTALNGKSGVLDKNSTLFLRELITEQGAGKLIKFTIKCTAYGKLTRNKIASYFLECADESHMGILSNPPVKISEDQIKYDDLKLMESMVERTETPIATGLEIAPSLDMLLANSETLID